MGLILNAEVGFMTKIGVAVCFRHAVLRAMEGQEIKVLLEESPVYCADCIDEKIKSGEIKRMSDNVVNAIWNVIAPAGRQLPAKPTGTGLDIETGEHEPDADREDERNDL